YDSAFLGGVRVAVGDVNDDGVADIVTVPGPGGRSLVHVFSGQDAALLLSFNALDPRLSTGVYLAAGEVDHDGFADIVVAPDAGANAGPLVLVFSGKALMTGVAVGQAQLLPGFDAYDPAFHGGVRVAVGDTNGDGLADIITGPGFGGGPLVTIFD